MNYSEAIYFDGNHCAHCVAWVDHLRACRQRELAQRYERNRFDRAR